MGNHLQYLVKRNIPPYQFVIDYLSTPKNHQKFMDGFPYSIKYVRRFWARNRKLAVRSARKLKGHRGLLNFRYGLEEDDDYTVSLDELEWDATEEQLGQIFDEWTARNPRFERQKKMISVTAPQST